nr:MAG TPA: hypothetical protein [Caudoviricetes sp.]
MISFPFIVYVAPLAIDLRFKCVLMGYSLAKCICNEILRF